MTKEMAINILRGTVLGTDEQTHEAVFMAIKALKEQERVDAVEVVRCKDCVCCDRDNGSPWCGLVGLHVDDDHYCAWGERKEIT